MIELEVQPHQIIITGDLAVDDLPDIAQALAQSTTAVTLQLEEFDIPDGSAMAGFTRLLADVLSSGRRLTLHEPPQLVVHNLYRIGRHPHPLLDVIDMREEEAYG